MLVAFPSDKLRHLSSLQERHAVNRQQRLRLLNGSMHADTARRTKKSEQQVFCQYRVVEAYVPILHCLHYFDLPPTRMATNAAGLSMTRSISGGLFLDHKLLDSRLENS